MNTMLFQHLNTPHLNENNSRTTWIWALPLLCLLFLLGGQLLALLPMKYLGLITKDNVEQYPHILYFIMGAFAMAAAVNLLWVRYFERQSLSSLGLSFNARTLPRYLTGLGLGLLFGAVIVYLIYFLGGYAVEREMQPQLSDWLPVLIMLLAFIIQGGTEEILFRGWLMSRLHSRYGAVVAVLGNSILFTVMHGASMEYETATVLSIIIFFTTCFLLSIFLSLHVIKTGSIWGACAFHASWNWVFINVFGLPTTGLDLNINPIWRDYTAVAETPVWLNGGAMGPEDTIVTIAVLLVGCIWCAHAIQKSPSK